MSDNDDDFDNDEGEASTDDANGPKALRAELKKLKARAAALEAENSQFKATVKKQSVAEALKQHGAKESLARYYDKDEASSDDVLAWLKENGEDFGWSESGPDLDDENVREARRISGISNMGSSGLSDPRIDSNWIRTASHEDLVKAGIL